MPGALCAVSPKHSTKHLVNDGEDSTVCEQQDQNFFFFFCAVEILSREKVPYRDAWSHCRTAPPPGSVLPPWFCSPPAPEDTGKRKSGLQQWGNEMDLSKESRSRKWVERGKKTKEDERKLSRKRETEQKTLCVQRNITLSPRIQKPRGQQSHSTLHLKHQPKSCVESRSESYSTGWVKHLHMDYHMHHTYALTANMRSQTCDVCHWFCGGRHIHFISLLSSGAGLSICQPQKLPVKVNKAQLSNQFEFSFFVSFLPKSDGEEHFVV